MCIMLAFLLKLTVLKKSSHLYLCHSANTESLFSLTTHNSTHLSEHLRCYKRNKRKNRWRALTPPWSGLRAYSQTHWHPCGYLSSTESLNAYSRCVWDSLTYCSRFIRKRDTCQRKSSKHTHWKQFKKAGFGTEQDLHQLIDYCRLPFSW